MKTTYKIMLLVISLLLVISITIGTSYSLWKKVEVQKEQNIVESSCFSIEFSESSNINLKNAMPISDTSGLKKTPYTFTIKNTCNADSKTKISLNVLNSSTMDTSIIKFSMKYGSLANSTPVLLNTFNKGESSTNVKESYLVKEDIIRGNEEKTYSIYLWMDESAGNEYMNKIFNAKVSVTSEAIEDTPKYMAETITDLASKDTVNFADDDPDNNIRYIGKDPSNYVYFNCSDYNNQSDSTCEKWRIIGLFKNMTKEDGTQEDLVKIMRKEAMGYFAWNSSTSDINSGMGTNIWNESKINFLLNRGHESLENGGSLYYNSSSGQCYVGPENELAPCDFTTTGLKNADTKNKIESVKWNLGSLYYGTTPEESYNMEHNISSNSDYWIGEIGLIQPSDYAYATSGGSTPNRTKCLNYSLAADWMNASNEYCKDNDYIYVAKNVWSMNRLKNHAFSVMAPDSYGRVGNGGAHGKNSINPTLYLKSNISITSGDGSSTSPYQLSLN